LHPVGIQDIVGTMKRVITVTAFLIYLAAQPALAAPPPAANAAFEAYARNVETRLSAQHSSAQGFISPTACSSKSACIERIAVTNLPGALLHHWRATQFVPGAKAADMGRLLRDISRYPVIFAPQVERASETPSSSDCLRVAMRLRQHHVITVVLDAGYDVSFAQLDAQHRFSISRSTHIAEVDSPGTPRERALPQSEEHGFLWRQNTYWSYEERPGGLLIQVESLSLTRSIPTGLGWAIGPYIESIPRESLEFTLRSICAGLLRTPTSASEQTHH